MAQDTESSVIEDRGLFELSVMFVLVWFGVLAATVVVVDLDGAVVLMVPILAALLAMFVLYGILRYLDQREERQDRDGGAGPPAQ